MREIQHALRATALEIHTSGNVTRDAFLTLQKALDDVSKDDTNHRIRLQTYLRGMRSLGASFLLTLKDNPGNVEEIVDRYVPFLEKTMMAQAEFESYYATGREDIDETVENFMHQMGEEVSAAATFSDPNCGVLGNPYASMHEELSPILEATEAPQLKDPPERLLPKAECAIAENGDEMTVAINASLGMASVAIRVPEPEQDPDSEEDRQLAEAIKMSKEEAETKIPAKPAAVPKAVVKNPYAKGKPTLTRMFPGHKRRRYLPSRCSCLSLQW